MGGQFKITPNLRGQMAFRYLQGESILKLSKDFNVHYNTILNNLHRLNVPLRPKANRKPAVVPRAQNEIMSQMQERGRSYTQIAKVFELSQRAVIMRVVRYRKQFVINK